MATPGEGDAAYLEMGWVGMAEGVREALLGVGLQALKQSTRISIGNSLFFMVTPLRSKPSSLRVDEVSFIC